MPTAQRVYAMFENESLWDTATRCHELLAAAKIPHAVIGGVAVCLHGYQRNTVDLDLLVRKDDASVIQSTLSKAGFVWGVQQAECRGPLGTPVKFAYAGDLAGEGSQVAFPDPSAARVTTEIEGLPVLTALKLIELKIASALGDVRRSHKEYADVVEIIATYRFDESFERSLHKSLRATFRELVAHAGGNS